MEPEVTDSEAGASEAMNELTGDPTTTAVGAPADDEDVLLLEEVDESLVLPVWEPTGEPRVDAALDRLVELDPDDVAQHATVFDEVHQALRATLTDLEPSS
jgi:hypothetical protein